ncbi:MAG TPA: DUF1842 domain-containing protein [Pyrinomonadaceae bacterium]|jgi:hypothetical protein
MSTQTTATAAASGAFLVNYRIGNSMPGAPSFTVNLVVSAPNKTVNGAGEITQAVNPPLNVPTHLSGEYTYMTVMPNNSNILVTLRGMGPINPIQPLVANNTRMWLILSKDWKSGTANYEYRYGKDSSTWQTVEGVPVTLIPSGNPR